MRHGTEWQVDREDNLGFARVDALKQSEDHISNDRRSDQARRVDQGITEPNTLIGFAPAIRELTKDRSRK